MDFQLKQNHRFAVPAASTLFIIIIGLERAIRKVPVDLNEKTPKNYVEQF